MLDYQDLSPGHRYYLGPLTTNYGADYLSCYEQPAYRDASPGLSRIRLDLVTAHFPKADHVVDVGYGDGAFLRAAHHGMFSIGGIDVSGIVPEIPGLELYQSFSDIPAKSVVTFFDSLEHFVDADLGKTLQTLKQSGCAGIVVSIPWWHPERGESAFEVWHHRKPGEHFHHFTAYGLSALFRAHGFCPVFVGNPEDVIRQSMDGSPNILTMIARHACPRF